MIEGSIAILAMPALLQATQLKLLHSYTFCLSQLTVASQLRYCCGHYDYNLELTKSVFADSDIDMVKNLWCGSWLRGMDSYFYFKPPRRYACLPGCSV